LNFCERPAPPPTVWVVVAPVPQKLQLFVSLPQVNKAAPEYYQVSMVGTEATAGCDFTNNIIGYVNSDRKLLQDRITPFFGDAD
jgi:hypothetical protein